MASVTCRVGEPWVYSAPVTTGGVTLVQTTRTHCMNSYEFDGFVSFTLAIILLFIGKALIGKIEILRRYSIPEPVIGGFLCAAAVGVAYFFFAESRLLLQKICRTVDLIHNRQPQVMNYPA